MKIAVLGPIAKDYIEVDDQVITQIGGIPYYVGVALQSLGVEKIVPYVTCCSNDNNWVKENFFGLDVICLPAEKTLESQIKYSSSNPDVREHVIKCYNNTIKATLELLAELEEYDYIIFGPLFHDNISLELFEKLKHKNLVLGNFGLFTHGENDQFVRKNPENLIKVLSYLKYLFLDRSEAEYVSGKEGINEAANYLQFHGLVNMIITEGSKGSHLFIGKDYYQIPAFPPQRLVDTTGAGDTYLAAFIKSLELFDDPQKQGRFAAMIATMSLETKGAFRGNIKDVMNKLSF